jgi:hypothetical protein
MKPLLKPLTEDFIHKIGVCVSLSLALVGGVFFIVSEFRKSNKENLKLKNHIVIKRKHTINSRVHVDTTIKGYIYITLRDGTHYVISPTRKLTTENKIYEHLFSGDSLIKYSGEDTLRIIKGYKRPEKFLLLY